MTYYLKLKDRVNLEKLARQNGGEYDVVNTAKWGESESSYTYKTKYEYLDKQLLNEDELGGASRTARYQITFNPAKAPIVDPDTGKVPETMTLTDTISANQSLDYSSVSIVTDPGGMSVPFSADDNSGGETVVTYTVPNETMVTVNYETLITGTGSTTFTNTAKVLDRNAPVSNTKEFGAAGESEGAIPSFTIVKVDGYDASKKLSGVKFKIYAEDDQLNFGENANYAKEITLTTEDGEIVLDGTQYAFYYDKIYYIEEVEGHDGYGKISSPYQVTLTNDISKVDHGKHIYYYSDTMQIKNWPLEGLVVEKQVNSTEEADLKKDYTFKVSILNDDESVNTDYNETNGDDTFVNGVFEFNLKNGGQKMFWGFEKGTKYKVEEIDADGFTTTVKYDVYDDDGNITGTKTETAAEHSGELTQADETIIFTNTKESEGSLKLKKAVTVKGKESSGQEADGDYTFTIAGPTSADEADRVARTVVITIENGAMNSAAIDDGTATIGTDGYVEVTGLAAGDYTITETAPDNGTVLTKAEGGKSVSNDKVVTATVVAGQTADAVADAGKVSFTNNKPDTPSFEKKIMDTNDSTGDSSDWQDSADYDIGDEIPYKLTAVLPSDASSYQRYTITFQDKMEESLDFAGVSQVVLRTTGSVETEIEAGNYVLNSSTHEFTLAIAWGAQAPENMPITEDLDGATVEVYFTATLNDNARIGSDGNVNAARLQYSNNPGNADSSDTTLWDYVTAFTYKLDVNKVDQVGNALNGAEFKLEKKLADGSMKSITLSNENNVFTGTGLDDGDYVLTETTTPEGCDPIDPIEFTVSADHTVTWNYNSTDLSFDGSTDRTTILTALTGSTESGDLVFTTPQQVSGLVGTVKNQGIGALKIKKSVTENGGEVSSNNTKTALAGDYTFTIYTDEACTKPYQENGEDKTVTLTIPETCEAVTSDEVTGLPAGDYWIKETAPSNGSAPVTNPVKVTVEAGKTGVDAVVAEFTNNIETTEASVLKVWSDAEDQDGKRPESLTVTLSNGTEDVGTVTLNEENGWTAKVENLPKYADGKLITYIWTEGSLPDSYQLIDTSVNGTVTTLTNSHTPEVTKVEGEKTWTGDNESLRPKSVTIGLYAGDTKKDEQVISKDSNWKYSFTDLPKYEGGEEIEYTVKEETDLPGYVSTVNGYDIESSYSASGEYELEAVKKLTGRSFKTGDSWTFDVACDDADAPMPEETSVTINPSKDNSCDVNFGRITYSAADHGKTYTYTITETGTVAGVTNQADSVEIKVTVTDNGNGTLKIEAEGDGDSAVFTNEYAAEGSVTLKAQKELSAYEGKTLKDGQFSFELYQGGELKQTKQNDADGNVKFDSITYTKAGTYTYTIKEVIETKDGYKYDTAEKKVTVTVVDNLDGTMTCTPAYDGGSATFTNIYEARGSASLKAAKTLENRTLEDKQFMFQLINEETGVVMQTVYNDAAGNITFSAVEYKKPGTYNYTIREVVQDKQGYTYDNSEKKTVVTVTDIDNGVLVTEVKYDGSEDIPEFANKFKASVSIRKVDAADGKVLEEATIQLLDEEGKIVEEWVSDKTPHEVEGLKTGEEYTLREAAAPDGYTVTPDTEFTIDEYGNVTSQGTITEDGILLIEDMKTKVKVSKVDIASGEELEGAALQILDKDENVLEEWTSTKEVHGIEGLKTGEEYTLRETAAPDGYTVAADTTFTIDETGKVTSTGTITEDGMMLVEDAKTVVKVSKVDIASGEELEGAALQILDKDENVIEEWTSTKEVHEIKGLKTGEEYTLRETAAPDGYTVAADTTFTIDETGKVTSTGTITEDGVMLVEDAKTKVRVSKVDAADKKPLEGATIRILDKDGNAVEEWISTKEVHVVEGLAVGVEYTLHEVKAPDGYETAADAVFSIDQSGKVTTTGSITEDGVLLIKDVKTKVPDKPDKPDNKKKKRSPRTGDDAGAMLWLLLGAGAAGVIVFLNKKRKKAH